MTQPNDIEIRVRQLLTERADAQLPTVETTRELRRLLARFPGERRRWRLQVAAATVAVAAAVAALVVAGLAVPAGVRGGKAVPAGGLRLPPFAGTIPASKLPAPALQWTVGKRFTAPVPGLVVGSTLWVDDVHETTVTRIDVHTHRVLGTVTYGVPQPYLTGPLVRAGEVVLLPVDDTTAGGDARLLRFSATSGRELAAIRVDRAGAAVASPVGVVAQVGPSTVGVVDPGGARVERTFTLPIDRGIVVTGGLIWGWDVRSQTLVGVDLSTGRRMKAIHLPGCADLPFVADGSDAVLMRGPDGLVRVDLQNATVTARADLAPVAAVPDARGHVWAVDGAQLVELDATTLRMIRRYAAGRADAAQVVAGSLFVADNGAGRVRVFALDRLAG